MPNTKPSLLIVDDDPAVRTSLSSVLTEVGYRVRTAEEGFGALAEMREEVPDILISDLNMPGMSGFELLAVMRRRFPGLQTIAMSGAFAGDEVPSGVAANAFFQKGSSMASLLRILENLPHVERAYAGRSSERAQAWILNDGHSDSGEVRVAVSCPECLRTFSHSLNGLVGDAWQGVCTHCQGVVPLATEHSAHAAGEGSGWPLGSSAPSSLQKQPRMDRP